MASCFASSESSDINGHQRIMNRCISVRLKLERRYLKDGKLVLFCRTQTVISSGFFQQLTGTVSIISLQPANI